MAQDKNPAQRVDSNILSSDSADDKFDLKQEKLSVVIREALPIGLAEDKFNPRTDAGQDTQEEIWIPDGPLESLYPLDMVTLIIEDPSGISIEFVVPAIYLKDIAYQDEWQRAMALIRLAANILVILVATVTLAAGVGGFLAALSIVDLGLATGDLVVQKFEEELNSTPEGSAFLEAWNTIYLVGGGLTGITALPGLLRLGAKLLVKIYTSITSLVEQVVRMLQFAIKQSTKLGKTFIGNIKIIANALGSVPEFGFPLSRNLSMLQEEGVLLIKSEVTIEGKIQTKYYLVFNEAIIVEANSVKQLKGDIEPFFSGKNGSGKVLKEALEQAANAVNIFTRDGNWFWTNAMGTQLRWANVPLKTIVNNIENALKKYRNVDPGKFFEAEVAKQMIYLTKKFGDEITDFANRVWKLGRKAKFDLTNGDIDCATKKYIIETKSNLGSNEKINKLHFQLQKYIPENRALTEMYLNPLNKKVVVVYDDLGTFTLNHPLLKELKDNGVIFIKGINNLKKLY